MNLKRYCLLGAAGLLFSGCSTLTETKVRNLNRMADATLAKMVLERPGLQAELGIAAGTLVFEWSESSFPMVGTRVTGVLIEQPDQERTLVSINKVEIDGAQWLDRYTGVVLIKDPEFIKRAKTEWVSLEKSGTIFIFAEGGPTADYPVKLITIEPAQR